MASPKTRKTHEEAVRNFMYQLSLKEMSRKLKQEAFDNNLFNRQKGKA